MRISRLAPIDRVLYGFLLLFLAVPPLRYAVKRAGIESKAFPWFLLIGWTVCNVLIVWRLWQRRRREPRETSGLTKLPRIHRKEAGVYVFNTAATVSPPNHPVHRLLSMVLLLAARDGVASIRFEPWRFNEDVSEGLDSESTEESNGFKLLFNLNGQDHELVPPPLHMRLDIAREIETLSGLNRFQSRFADFRNRRASKRDGLEPLPRQGVFLLRISDWTLNVKVLAHQTHLGERYELSFLDGLSNVSNAASELLRSAVIKEMEHLNSAAL